MVLLLSVSDWLDINNVVNVESLSCVMSFVDSTMIWRLEAFNGQRQLSAHP